jgi:hypothetical protein
MKISLIPVLAVIACIIACKPGNYQSKDTTHPVDSFRIAEGATVTDKNGKKIKLADVIKSDSTLVMRVTNSHPEESQHIVLYKVRWFTDKYPPTDSIILLADDLPADSGWGWPGILRTTSFKIRVFKIDSSLLPPGMESQQRSYVFYLDKKLHAGRVYVPDSLTGDKTNDYFARAAATMRREQTNPLLEHTKGMTRSYGSYDSNTEMYLDNRRINVGPSVVNRVYYEDFYFLNSGNKPLVIYKVMNNWNRSGCKVEVPDVSIRPGQRGRIRVYYRPWEVGSFRNEVSVYSNASGSPHRLIITGTSSKGRSTRVVGTY